LRGLAVVALLGIGSTACAAPTAVHRGDAQAGRAKADDERCIECHVARDPATAQPGDGLHALLDGQSVAYLAKQMSDYRSGAREHAVMTLMARNLDDGDLADILAWYAAKPWRSGAGTAEASAAQRLYTEGDAARGIAACATCHGSAGMPPRADTPRIAGQDAAYLAAQLEHWRSGDRRNTADAVMGASARALTDLEIKALAAAISAMQ
jgi:cytochrome c553